MLLTEEGGTVEVSMVGEEGMVGLSAIFKANYTPYQSVVQTTATTLRIRADKLRAAFDGGGQLRDTLLGYTSVMLSQFAQAAVCHRFHTIEQRLCNWLLLMRDRTRAHTFQLTQELIANTLGVPRTKVTMKVAALQRGGSVQWERGQITITDTHGLEAAACECYRLSTQAPDAPPVGRDRLGLF
jgi:CRP-like cAMP-binding protein